MPDRWNRRDVLKTGVAAGVAGVGTRAAPGQAPAVMTSQAKRPLVISSGNGLAAAAKAMEMVQGGADTLDAVIAGVNIVERDPDDMSVGYGGLPNEEGVVQLDASVMHGPTRRAGAVGAIEGVKTPSNVAQLVAYRTDHVLLVGEGANRFAATHGYGGENLLTDRARQAWLRWKENLSDRDEWLAPERDGQSAADLAPIHRDYGTINCNAVDAAGNISGVTTTSGLSFKIPGRLGDSPILGAGLYVDNDIGACGSTGRGEANLVECASFLVVELMRGGAHPKDAAIEALRRIATKTVAPRLLNDEGRPNFGLRFYCLNKAGQYAGASMYGQIGNGTAQFAVNDGGESRHEDCAALFDVMPR
jgi:N4-(beta-N-acetylglucosaminyl)-L-asparaginase